MSLNLPGLDRIRKSFKDPTEAHEFDAQAVARHRLGLPVETQGDKPEGSPKTLRELFHLTYDKYWKNSKAEESARSACSVVEALMGEDQPITGIDQTWIELLVKRLQARKGNHGGTLTGSTINRKLACLSRALRYAERMSWIVRAPKCERSKENRHRLRFLTQLEEQEFHAAFAFLGDTAMDDLFVCLIDSGMRLSEALNLRTEQADLTQGSIHLWAGTTKNDLGRSVPITHRVRNILIRRRSQEDVFPEITVDAATKRFNRAKALTSTKNDRLVVLHTLRHTFASRLVQAGVPIPTISALLGHSSLQMTMRYAHLAPANLLQAIQVLNGINGATGNGGQAVG